MCSSDLVAAGIKPLAVVGCGYTAPAFIEQVASGAVGNDLVAQMGHPWASTLEPDIAWFRAARRAMLDTMPVLYVAAHVRDKGFAALAGQRVDVATEAAALGYPQCCVREFNRQQRLLHLITLRMIARQAGHDEARMRRLVEAQVMLAPRSPAETRALALATRATFAPFMSVAMCRACVSDGDSPARRLSTRFRDLAIESGFDRFLQ